MNSINPPSCDYLKTPVVWNEDVYALGRDHNQDGKLFKYSITNNGWSEFSVLSSIYASNSALITYRSKLLLISGEGMSVWEFNSNDLAFKPSSIKPVPTEYAHSYSFFTAISRDKYLVTVCMLKTLRCCFDIAQLIYDGQDWKFREYGKFTFCSGYSIQCVINSHATLIFLFNDLIVNFDSIVKIWKAPILSNDESKVSAINWEVLDISLLQIPDYRYPPILHDQKLYFVNSKGDIRISFIQSPLLPEVWGNSGVNFRRAPHIIGLPNGTLLMTGMVGEQDEAQLDVIKVTQKGNKHLRLHYSVLPLSIINIIEPVPCMQACNAYVYVFFGTAYLLRYYHTIDRHPFCPILCVFNMLSMLKVEMLGIGPGDKAMPSWPSWVKYLDRNQA